MCSNPFIVESNKKEGEMSTKSDIKTILDEYLDYDYEDAMLNDLEALFTAQDRNSRIDELQHNHSMLAAEYEILKRNEDYDAEFVNAYWNAVRDNGLIKDGRIKELKHQADSEKENHE